MAVSVYSAAIQPSLLSLSMCPCACHYSDFMAECLVVSFSLNFRSLSKNFASADEVILEKLLYW